MHAHAGGRSEVAIGVQVASFVLDRGFSEFYRSSTVSLYCRTLVAVSTSVQIRQAPSTFHPEVVCWSQGTAGLAVLRVVTELYMIVRDLFQLSWLISWLTTVRHPSSLPVCPCHTTIGMERAIIRLVPRCHTATYKPTLLHGSLDNPS